MVGSKKQNFRQKINILKGNHCNLRIREAPVSQKLDMILENKVIQKLKLEKNVFHKKRLTKLILLNEFFFEKNPSIFDLKNLKVRFRHFDKPHIIMLILGQKSCILGPTIFKIPHPN